MSLRHSHFKTIAGAIAVWMVLAVCSAQEPFNSGNTAIVTSSQATGMERLAARELRRYIYLATGEWLPLVEDRIEPGKNLILTGDKSRTFIQQTANDDLKGRLTALTHQQYIIKSVPRNGKVEVLISGGDESGTLYGAYRFIETLGVRFYLHDDVVPEEHTALQLTNLDITGKPLFSLRGILPFHDFPEGPDWWSLEDYKAHIAQLPKMGMNFVGFHSYPEEPFEGRFKAEPMVWVGTKDEVNRDGTVTATSPVTHSYTRDDTWGYFPRKTSDFSCGASQLFDADYYGAPYMDNISAWPHTPQENVKLVNDFGKLLHDAFGFARKLGIKTCIGTETPLNVPQSVQEKLFLEGKDPQAQAATKQELYEAMFERIMKTHPLDYFWLWTPEWWTWRVEPRQADVVTEMDLLNAVRAAREVNAPFTLATCGWVLGPARDRTEFDHILPKDMPFSCINRLFGFIPVDPGFKTIQDRPKWAIPWLEYDWPLIEPQLWAGRVRRDALDAYNYGCNGLIGIHWRTEILSPQIGALAQAGWEFGDWTNHPDAALRDLPVIDFYQDWVTAQFGRGLDGLVELFASLDGGPPCNAMDQITSNLPRSTGWGVNGPGLLMINMAPWSRWETNYAFVDKLAVFEKQIHGAANMERFAYWLNTFRYMKAVGHTGCLLGELENAMAAVNAETNRTNQIKMIDEAVMPLRKQVGEQWTEMVTRLLSTVGTTGAMGTIANLELHSLTHLELLTRHDRAISVIQGRPVAPIDLGKEYRGPSRIIVPAKRTLLETNEDLNLKVIVLSKDNVKSVALYWKPLGQAGDKYQTVEARHVTRGVYDAVVPAAAINGQDFEYYVQANLESETLKYPITAPALNHSVVVN